MVNDYKVGFGRKKLVLTFEFVFVKIKADAPVETVTFENFFAPATTLEDWFGDEEKQSAAQFQTLVATLKTQLTELTVHKIGEAKKTVVVIGKTCDNDYAGVTTKVVET